MVAPAILADPQVRKWLGDVEPAWASLDQRSFDALKKPPPAGSVRLAADLASEELQQSAVAANALILLRAAMAGDGLKLTTTGNLARSVVAEMRELFTWPEFDEAEAFRFHKVINEPDFLPLYFTRHIVQSATLLRPHKGFLKATTAGRQLVERKQIGALQAILFHVAMWHVELDYLGRGLHAGWHQRHVGIVLWALSVAATDWQPRESLTRQCTIPVNDVAGSAWDSGSYAMEAQILRPLQWFGLLEHREEDVAGSKFAKRQFYRKTGQFDRFLSFDVSLEVAGVSRH